jgi:phosphomannomutase
MKVIESIFREYDIRGTYPEEINEGVISIIGQAIALKCKQEGYYRDFSWKRWKIIWRDIARFYV